MIRSEKMRSTAQKIKSWKTRVFLMLSVNFSEFGSAEFERPR